MVQSVSRRRGRSQVVLVFASHGEYFDVYFEHVVPLKGFKLGSRRSNKDTKYAGAGFWGFYPKFKS